MATKAKTPGFGVQAKNTDESSASFGQVYTGKITNPRVSDHARGDGKHVYFSIGSTNFNFGVFNWNSQEDSNFLAVQRLQDLLEKDNDAVVATFLRRVKNDQGVGEFTDVFVAKATAENVAKAQEWITKRHNRVSQGTLGTGARSRSAMTQPTEAGAPAPAVASPQVDSELPF